ncbi:MAG: hypothetical protein R3F10_13090 [Lysobacteraceae bacterium]
MGTGREADSTFGFAWKWSAETGQVRLPATEQMRINAPLGISNDGARIVGESNQMVEEIPGEGEIEIEHAPPPSPMPVAIEWIDGQPPGWVLTPGQTGPFPTSEIFDCDADCRLISGTGRPSVEAVPPEGFTEAWYRCRTVGLSTSRSLWWNSTNPMCSALFPISMSLVARQPSRLVSTPSWRVAS